MIIKDVGSTEYKTASLFFDRSREALCEIGSEMDIRTRDTVNSRLADTLLLRAPRQYEQPLNPSLLRTFVCYQGH